MVALEDLDLTPDPPRLTELAAEHLGNAGHDSDGFPTLFSHAVEGFAFGPAALRLIDGEQARAEEAFLPFVPEELREDAAQLGIDLQTGRKVLKDFTDLMTPPDAQTTPTPPGTPPTVPSAGGGGSGAGGIILDCVDCTFEPL